VNSTVLERFLRYVTIDTQSDPRSKTQPSTEKQKDLGRLLVEELLAIGLADAHLDEHGNVYATVPANTDKQVPVICFCAHMDTAPDYSGAGVKPQIVEGYNGGDIQLKGDSRQIIRVSDNPELADQIGNDIITTDGTTLLGADDKAGVAEIVAAAQILVDNPDIRRGTVKLLFTTDEEIGRGVDKIDLFSILPVANPGWMATGKMENAIKIAAAIVDRLPKDAAPETTEGRQGFLHPTDISGAMEKATISLIIRDFEDAGLVEKETMLEALVRDVMNAYPGSSYTFKVTEQYRNMKVVLDRHPEIVEHAMEAVRRAGMEPALGSIRGGTDGSRLSHMGLPCPNIFAGGHAFHSPLEWVSRQDMEKAVATIVELVRIWEERA
jgi:tripeptide aminopeptidase